VSVEASVGTRPSRLGPLVSPGSFFFRYRDFLFPAVFLPLVVLTDPIPLGSRSSEIATDALGIAVALAGQLVRALVIGLAYIRRGGLHKRVYADTLVVEGVFAHSRNPLYLGNFLAVVGFSIIHHSLLCYLVAIPFFALVFLAIVAAEEDFLERKFGEEYDAYRRRVNRFLPSLRGLGRTMQSMRFDWKRLVRKEYGATFTGLSFALALLIWDQYARTGAVPASLAWAVALVWAVVAAAYLTARHFKKSGALGRGWRETTGRGAPPPPPG
jgi:protein-S-isoprenylcysteine O-methyltransferase Ste14